jgi:hypothetical protein
MLSGEWSKPERIEGETEEWRKNKSKYLAPVEI